MTDYKQLCTELVDRLEGLYDELVDSEMGWVPPEAQELMTRAHAALAEPEPEGPTDEPMIPDHYRGDDIRVYREGFHAGYKYAFQLMPKCSNRSA